MRFNHSLYDIIAPLAIYALILLQSEAIVLSKRSTQTAIPFAPQTPKHFTERSPQP